MSLVVGMEPSGALVPTVEDFPEDLPFGCSAVPPPWAARTATKSFRWALDRRSRRGPRAWTMAQ